MKIDYTSPIRYSHLTEFANTYKAEPLLQRTSIGTSILGRELPLFILGNGKSASLFVGTHHAAESITSLFLLHMIEDILSAAKSTSGKLRGFDIPHILMRRKLFILPMLNPDGVELRHMGAKAAGILEERVKKMNGSDDFSLWQANARGVDLNHNYNAEFLQCKAEEHALGIFSGGPTRYGGPFPESEPESAALATLTRWLAPNLTLAMALHTQGEEIYHAFGGHIPKNGRMLAECMARASGYRVAAPPKEASFGGYKDYVIDAFDIPAFTIECGHGKNPLPASDFYKIYERLLPLLLTAAAF